ncbi:MAG: hypothetical protein GEV11_17805 [Streptosporangiales bacterium]|nr:hypothetical protein [Streptosporangiales bacterium]
MIVDPYQAMAATAADRDPADVRRSALPGARVVPAPATVPAPRLRGRIAAALRDAADRLESVGSAG